MRNIILTICLLLVATYGWCETAFFITPKTKIEMTDPDTGLLYTPNIWYPALHKDRIKYNDWGWVSVADNDSYYIIKAVGSKESLKRLKELSKEEGEYLGKDFDESKFFVKENQEIKEKIDAKKMSYSYLIGE